MCKQVKISVLMSVFNEKEYLESAINSIGSQSYTDWELIIVLEYGANRETRNIVHDYEKKDNRIRVVENKNHMGFAASLNLGIKKSRGKYIARMDSDDISCPKRLQYQFDYLEAHPDVFLCGGNIRNIVAGRLTKNKRYLSKWEQIQMSLFFTCEFAHPTVMFRRDIAIKDELFYNVNIKTEDYELWSRIVYTYKVVNLNKCLLYYRLHNNNSIVTGKDAVSEATKIVQQNLFDTFGVNIRFKNQILDGAHSEDELEKIEQAFLDIMEKTNSTFRNELFVFHNRMDVFYRNTECNLNRKLKKQKRYWDKYGTLYGKKRYILQIISFIYFTCKDIAWKVMC